MDAYCANDDRRVQRVVDDLVRRQVAFRPERVGLLSQQQSLRVFVNVVEQFARLFAIRKGALQQQVHIFNPRVGDFFLVLDLFAFEGHELGVLLAVHFHDLVEGALGGLLLRLGWGGVG